ncbi:MAG: MOSC N-terminal beta barrel domain-containing protein [Ignavibacteria bacterium]|nr:MOSC N-terminal beta barrel domain-containing protein [Ignavibacteria bacterium]
MENNFLTISEINIYPVKSLGGISLNESKVEKRGLQFDRRWLLVDKENMFITQREINELCLFKINLTNEGFIISNDKASEDLIIPFGIDTGEKSDVTIWDDTCEAIHYSDEANKWFSDIVDYDCRLVYMPDTTRREANKDFAIADDIVSFADGYPILIIGQSSLDNYNYISGNNFKMNRFRPNLVFTGGKAHVEDTLRKFNINGTDFYGVKTCGRCVITTIEQETAVSGKEPLKTLAEYRTVNNSIKFGMNVIPGPLSDNSIVRIGDEINVMETA